MKKITKEQLKGLVKEEVEKATSEIDPKVQALMEFLGEDDPDSIAERGSDIFTYGREEYLVCDDLEADAKVGEDILDSVWAFNPSFLEAHTGVDAEAIEAIQEKMSEDANEPLKRMIKDLDHFVKDAVLSDGRGHFLSPYDGEENEEKIGGEYFFIYRQN